MSDCDFTGNPHGPCRYCGERHHPLAACCQDKLKAEIARLTSECRNANKGAERRSKIAHDLAEQLVELRREVEQLRKERSMWLTMAADFLEERNEYRAEVDRLTTGLANGGEHVIGCDQCGKPMVFFMDTPTYRCGKCAVVQRLEVADAGD